MKAAPSNELSPGYSCESLAELLAPALGREQSTELVAVAAARLGLKATRLADAEAISILDALSADPGLVGVAARFARMRLKNGARKPSSLPARSFVRAEVPANPAKPPAPKTFRCAEVSTLLENAIGKERSQELVRAQILLMNFREPLELREVLKLLDRLGESGGVVGTVVQFAKSRLMLAAR